MRIDISAGKCILTAALGVFLYSSPLGAQPADEDIAQSVKRWLDEMAKASSFDEILKARQGFAKTYAFRDGRGQGFAYAQETSRQLIPRLKEYDAVKLINLTMVVSKMPQGSIQPALDVLVAHTNPAVRYLGWRGYRDARVAILSLGGKPRETFFATLKRRAGVETSSVALRMLIATVRLPRSLGPRLGAAALKEAQQQALSVLESAWAAWCQRVIDQAEGMPAVAVEAVAVLLELYQAVGAPPKTQKALLQRIYEMMFCSSAAYRKSKADDSDPLAKANAKLLVTCEKALGAVSGSTSQRVQDALKKDDPDERKAFVGIAVIDWRKDLKLQEPPFKPGGPPKPPPATQPATQPATKPATQPATQPATKPAKGGPAPKGP